MNKTFPKNDPVFSNDSEMMHSIKNLEDRIEKTYLVEELIQSVWAIKELVEPGYSPKKNNVKLSPEMMADFKVLLNGMPEKSQFDIDRDTLRGLVDRYGKGVILLLLSPKLSMSLEVLFSGVVVKYIGMFNKSNKRSQLDFKNVFCEKDLRDTHLKFDNLRNKQYAHLDTENGRHQLCYKSTESGEIFINVDAPQISNQFHQEMCIPLYSCLTHVKEYLREDVKEKSRKITQKLSVDQMNILLNKKE